MSTKKNNVPVNENEAPAETKDLVAENEALKAELEAMKAQQEKTPEAPQEKMVKIRIPRTKKDEEDVFVSVNLRTWLIKRGVEVEVPECVAEVLRHQEEMLEEIMLFEEQTQRK